MGWWPKWLGLGLVLVWVGVGMIPDAKLHVVFCDVGQGDAVVVIKGSYQMLIDAGSEKSGVTRCLASHMPLWDRKLEVVVQTHDDADHSGGMNEVRGRYKIENWQPVLRKGDEVQMGEVTFETIWPDELVLGRKEISTENEESLVGMVRYGKFNVLLTGDAETDNYDSAAGVEVFKVPHHGSRTGLTWEWLDKARPEVAVISVGKNSYGHPAEELLEWLNKAGVRVMRTDEKGDIEIVSDGERWKVR